MVKLLANAHIFGATNMIPQDIGRIFPDTVHHDFLHIPQLSTIGEGVVHSMKRAVDTISWGEEQQTPQFLPSIRLVQASYTPIHIPYYV